MFVEFGVLQYSTLQYTAMVIGLKTLMMWLLALASTMHLAVHTHQNTEGQKDTCACHMTYPVELLL